MLFLLYNGRNRSAHLWLRLVTGMTVNLGPLRCEYFENTSGSSISVESSCEDEPDSWLFNDQSDNMHRFYSSQRHIGHATAHTWERGWGWLVLNLCGCFWWNSYVSSKIVRFLRKMDGPSRNLDKANFSPKKKGKQCAAFGCSNTFYGPNGLPTSFHFFKFMHGGMYFC